ncbi:MAG: PAS domain S-box protein [Actinobacteria bacterium]|nr:PAS domain S-box protein [Actinomycetota bacterium]
MRPPWIFLASCAVVGGAAVASGPTGQEFAYPFLGFACVAAMVASIALNRPRAPGPMHAFAVATALFATGDLIRAVGIAASQHVVDGLFLAAYPFLIAGLMLLAKRASLGTAIDAGIIGASLFVLSWTFLSDHLHGGHGDALVATAFPVLDLLILVFVVRYLGSGHGITRQAVLGLGGVVALVIGDLSYSGHLANSVGGVAPTQLFWLVMYALWGASALDRQRGPGRRLPALPAASASVRAALLVAAVLLATFALAFEQHHDRVGQLVVFAGASVISLLALARMWEMHLSNLRLLERQRQVVAEREQTASLLEATLDATAEGLIVTDRDGVIVAANARAAATWRISHARLIGSRIGEPARPSYLEACDPRASIDAILAKPESESFDVLELTDGRTVERFSSPQLLRGDVVGRVWSYRDVTERRRAEAAQRRSERRLSETLENVRLVAASIDARGIVTFANDFLLELTGWTREEVVGHDWFDRFDDDAGVRADYFRCMAEGEIRPHFESVIRTRAGALRTIRWSSTFQSGEDGDVASIVTIGEDVTERRDAEAELRRREEHFRSLIEHGTDVICVLAADGTSLYESPSVERVLGWSPGELLGSTNFDLHHPEDADRAAAFFAGILAGEPGAPIESRLRHRDGTWRLVETVGHLREQDGEPVVVLNYRDLTERRDLEEKLLHAGKLEAVGRLAGGVAHDFNNLLTAIGGYAEFLLASLDEDDERRADAVEIARAADRASALTRQLLAFSSRQVLRPEVLDAVEVVGELQNLLSQLLGAGVRLTTEGEDDCLVEADRGQVEQVITNLVVNARDAMPGGGDVTIAVSRTDDDGSWVDICVTDTGTGIDEATIEHIFEPFFTTKGKDEGTGLGLATVYGIVAQSGGTATVASELGVGTTFRVRLPLSLAAVAPDVVPDAPCASRGAETILLVEDEDMIRSLVRDVLTRSGYTVLDAPSGDAALELLGASEATIDLLVTDVVMPGMSGPALAELVVGERPDVRVLFMSGYTNEPEAVGGSPDSAFIAKPFAPQALVAKIRDVLETVRV